MAGFWSEVFSWLADGCFLVACSHDLYFVHIHGVRREREECTSSLASLLLGALTASQGPHSHDLIKPNFLLKSPFSKIITLGVWEL